MTWKEGSWKFSQYMLKATRNEKKFTLMHYTPTVHPKVFQNMSHIDEPETEEDKEMMSELSYASFVGHLQYLNSCTQPDLAYDLSKLSQYLKKPGVMHWQAAVGVLQYLEATKLVGLRYIGGLDLEGMCDSSWGDDVDDQKSRATYVFTMGETVVSWKLSEVSRSTPKAEYRAPQMLLQ